MYFIDIHYNKYSAGFRQKPINNKKEKKQYFSLYIT